MTTATSNSTDFNAKTIPPLNFARPVIENWDFNKGRNVSDLTHKENKKLKKQRVIAEEKRRRNSRQDHLTLNSSRDIPVDANIKELIEALWSIGFETQFSCEGYPECFDSSGTLENRQWASHIVFPHMSHASEFLEASYNHLMSTSSKFDWTSVMTLHPMLPSSEHRNIRAVVTFDPTALEFLTNFWKASTLTTMKE